MCIDRAQLIRNKTFEVFVILLLEPGQMLVVDLGLEFLVISLKIA